MSAGEKVRYYHNANDLDPELSASLLHWGLALADTKYLLGRRLSEWVNGAPALEAAVGAAAMTQDELGHARSLYSFLRDFPGAPEELGTEFDLRRSDFFSPGKLEKPMKTWSDVIAANVLFDRALNIVFDATRESQFGPLAQRAAKILQEESFHRIYGDSWLARLARSDGEKRSNLEESLESTWSLADAWIGPASDPVTKPLVAAGILAASPGALRERWLAQVNPLLAKHGLNTTMPEPDWTRWNADRREISYG
jgi:phenylacetate-CoA oxygenase PaaI subunit